MMHQVLAHIDRSGVFTVKGYPGTVELVTDPGRKGQPEHAYTLSVQWLDGMVAEGLVEWDDPTPVVPFTGSGGCGWHDNTKRDLRVTTKGRALLSVT